LVQIKLARFLEATRRGSRGFSVAHRSSVGDRRTARALRDRHRFRAAR
jgi:hypothetical protein